VDRLALTLAAWLRAVYLALCPCEETWGPKRFSTRRVPDNGLYGKSGRLFLLLACWVEGIGVPTIYRGSIIASAPLMNAPRSRLAAAPRVPTSVPGGRRNQLEPSQQSWLAFIIATQLTNSVVGFA